MGSPANNLSLITNMPMPTSVSVPDAQGNIVSVPSLISIQNVIYQMWQNLMAMSSRAGQASFQGPVNANGNTISGVVNSANPPDNEVATIGYIRNNLSPQKIAEAISAPGNTPMSTNLNLVSDTPNFARLVASGLQNNRLANFANGMIAGTAFPSAPSPGAVFYRTDLQRFFQYNGSVWIQVSLVSLDEMPDGTLYIRVQGVDASHQAGTSSLQLQSTTGYSNNFLGSQINLTYATWNTIMTVTFGSTQGQVLITTGGQIQNPATAAQQVDVRIVNHASQTQIGTTYRITTIPSGEPASWALPAIDTSPGPASAYDLQAYPYVSYANESYCASAEITLVNIKT